MEERLHEPGLFSGSQLTVRAFTLARDICMSKNRASVSVIGRRAEQQRDRSHLGSHFAETRAIVASRW